MAIKTAPQQRRWHRAAGSPLPGGDLAIVERLFSLFSPRVAALYATLTLPVKQTIRDIRLTVGKPLVITTSSLSSPPSEGDDAADHVGPSPDHFFPSIIIDRNDVEHFMARVTASSVYTVIERLQHGFLTIPGGHRVGVTGEVRMEGGVVAGFRHVAGLHVRVSRPWVGVARPFARKLTADDGTVKSTLVMGAPGAGKTTFLRDVIRMASMGEQSSGMQPHRVAVADERGEVSGAWHGLDQMQLGPRTDVMSFCPKSLAMRMMLRSTGPEVIATDEIGGSDDARLMVDMARAGVKLLCTAHASSPRSFFGQPSMHALQEEKVFDAIVLLQGLKVVQIGSEVF